MAGNGSSNAASFNALLLPPPFSDPAASPNTVFVRADPSTFRAIVQRLTGAAASPKKKLPVTTPPPARHSAAGDTVGPRRPSFKLCERRNGAAIRKLEVALAAENGGLWSPSGTNRRFLGISGEATPVLSPVSPLDLVLGLSSPARSSEEEEELRAIAEKGFYLHRSPLSTPRGSGSGPELLPLFPLHSPRDTCSPSCC